MVKRTHATIAVLFLPLLAVAQQYPQNPQYPPAQAPQYPPAQSPQYPPAPVQNPQYPQGSQYPQPQYPQGSQYPQSSQYPQGPQGPMMAPAQLDQVVNRIALYPDPLLAQVLTASTYWNEIADAATWAGEHANLTGDPLARAISDDRLQFDPSVMALLPFPSVLDMMARDPGWTQALGNAVLNQRPDVMDAVQRMRQRAYDYGYLRSNAQYNVAVDGPGAIAIYPADPNYLVVPRYDPYVVYTRPRAGFYVGGAISFGPRIYLGAAFAPWGWGRSSFGWRSHEILIDRRPWERTWVNREHYVHPYAQPYRRPEGRRVERHDVHEHHDQGRDRHERP